jgi:hypothetical protein
LVFALLPSFDARTASVGRGDILHFFETVLWFGVVCCVSSAGMVPGAADRRTA